MKLGLLTDIHEEVELLEAALAELERDGVEQIVVLGDVLATTERLAETVALLDRTDVVGVWGNHDFGLCCMVDDQVRRDYPAAVLDFMGRLQPRVEIGDCLFTHVEPWLDPRVLEEIWYFDGAPDSVEKADRSFRAQSARVMFMGHLHRWLAVSTREVIDWLGERPLELLPDERYLIVVHAVALGWCATYDTSTGRLTPIRLG